MRAIISSIKFQIIQSLSRPMFRFLIFINPIFSGYLLGMMYKNKSSLDFVIYAFIGTGLSIFWSSVIFSSASDIDRERWMGTLPLIFISPIGFNKIIISKIVGNTICGIFSFLLTMFTTYFLFDIKIKILDISYFFIITFLTVISMIGLGYLLSLLFTLSRKVRLLMNFIDYPIIIITGMLFPNDLLVMPLKYFSYIFCTTWSMKGYNIAVKGEGNKEFIVLILIILTFIYFLLGYIFFKKIDKLCRIYGTLEVF